MIKIDFSKFDRKRLFKSRILLFFVIGIATVGGCVLVSLISRGSRAEVEEKQEQVREIKIKPTKEVMSTESLWMNSVEDRLKQAESMQKANIEELKKQVEGISSIQSENAGGKAVDKKLSNLSKEVAELRSKKELKVNTEASLGSKEIKQFTLNLDNAKNSESYRPLKTADNYIPAGSFARAVLLSGVDAATSLNASGDPDPILIRIVDHGTLPRKFKSDLKDCHIIGAVYGDLSSERAKVRIEKLSCTEIATGEIIETEIAGYITGEDGRAGIRGEVVSTEGKLLGNSMVAGFFGGLANNFNTSTDNQPVALFASRKKESNLKERFTDSLAGGATSSLDRLSKYYIERAEALQPIVQVGAGRKVDVIFTEGVFFGTSEIKKAIAKKRDENIRNKSSDTNIEGNNLIRSIN